MHEFKKYHSICHVGVHELTLKDLKIKGLVELCYNIQKNYPTVLKSNVNGYQSPNLLGEISLFPLIHTINTTTQLHLGNPNYYLEEIWVNISPKGANNRVHTHQNHIEDHSKMCGVLYLQTSPNSGSLQVYNPIYVSISTTFNPSPGDLLLFESVIPHSVESNFSNKDRISIAFNFK